MFFNIINNAAHTYGQITANKSPSGSGSAPQNGQASQSVPANPVDSVALSQEQIMDQADAELRAFQRSSALARYEARRQSDSTGNASPSTTNSANGANPASAADCPTSQPAKPNNARFSAANQAILQMHAQVNNNAVQAHKSFVDTYLR